MKKRILLVDDEKDLLNLLKEGLNFAGYEVAGCDGGGIETVLVNTKEINPDLILMDLTMPDMNGFEVASRIQSDLSHKPKVVIMTCHLSDEDKLKGKSCGVDDYLDKPFTFKDVMEIVKRHIGNPQDV